MLLALLGCLPLFTPFLPATPQQGELVTIHSSERRARTELVGQDPGFQGTSKREQRAASRTGEWSCRQDLELRDGADQLVATGLTRVESSIEGDSIAFSLDGTVFHAGQHKSSSTACEAWHQVELDLSAPARLHLRGSAAGGRARLVLHGIDDFVIELVGEPGLEPHSVELEVELPAGRYVLSGTIELEREVAPGPFLVEHALVEAELHFERWSR